MRGQIYYGHISAISMSIADLLFGIFSRVVRFVLYLSYICNIYGHCKSSNDKYFLRFSRDSFVRCAKKKNEKKKFPSNFQKFSEILFNSSIIVDS